MWPMYVVNKAALLSPGAAHDRRAATERSPESADEIDSAARRGSRSGWRPSMMNEAADVRHGVVFNTTRKGPDILVVPIMTVFVPIVTKYT
jgi:hypothetical protein